MTDAEKIIKVLEYEAVPSEMNCVHGEYIEAIEKWNRRADNA